MDFMLKPRTSLEVKQKQLTEMRRGLCSLQMDLGTQPRAYAVLTLLAFTPFGGDRAVCQI